MALPPRSGRFLGCLQVGILLLSFVLLRAVQPPPDWTWRDLWRAGPTLLILYTMAAGTRVVTCYGLHHHFKCHRHSGTRAWRCWILDALTFGRLGHKWTAPGVQIDMKRSSRWRWFFWPIVYEGSITVKGETMEMISDRLDLPAPMRMNAACTVCWSVWTTDKATAALWESHPNPEQEKAVLLDLARKSPPPGG